MTDADNLNMATAFHKAGHAWGYLCPRHPYGYLDARYRKPLPLRYITIRPQAGGGRPGHGNCRAWKPRRLNGQVAAWISAAGPVAEAIWAQQSDTEDAEYYGDVQTGTHPARGGPGRRSIRALRRPPGLLRDEAVRGGAPSEQLTKALSRPASPACFSS